MWRLLYILLFVKVKIVILSHFYQSNLNDLDYFGKNICCKNEIIKKGMFMKKKNKQSDARYLGYHVYFNHIKTAKGKTVASIKGHQIVSESADFEKEVLSGNSVDPNLIQTIKRGKIKYNLVSSISHQPIAKVDSNYNVFSLENRFLGTFYDSTKKVKIILIFAILVMISLIITFVTMPKSGDSAKPKEILISEIDGSVVTDEWHIFGKNRFDSMIYPGKSGEYYFSLTNNNSMGCEANLNFGDNNIYDIPMRYRIKSKDGYVSGNELLWQKIEDLKLENIYIDANSTEVFVLEWYWLDNGRYDLIDTLVGTKEGYTYMVNITLTSYLKSTKE